MACVLHSPALVGGFGAEMAATLTEMYATKTTTKTATAATMAATTAATTAPMEGVIREASVGQESSVQQQRTTTPSPREQTFDLMALPVEIRLRIYHWLHLMCPVTPRQLAPWYTAAPMSRVTYRAVAAPLGHGDAPGEEAPKSNENDDGSDGNGSGSSSGDGDGDGTRLLPSDRPLAGLPTSLLQSCSQIYHEARELPFARNEFVFANWFVPGLWPAKDFVGRRLAAAWQIDAVRWVRLELLARDMVSGADTWMAGFSGLSGFAALCDAWSGGLRGLRLKLVMEGRPKKAEEEDGAGVGRREPGAGADGGAGTRRGADSDDDDDDDDETQAGIGEGLGRMRSLRRLELELVSLNMSDADKVEWCSKLEKRLRAAGSRAAVVCVVRAKPEEKKEKEEQTGTEEQKDDALAPKTEDEIKDL